MDKINVVQTALEACQPLRGLTAVMRRSLPRRPPDEHNRERLVQLKETLHLVEEKLKNDRPSIDSRVGDTNGLIIVAEQTTAPDRFRAAGSDEITEGDRADQVLRRRSGAATEADRLDRGGFGNKATPATHERLAQPVIFGPKMMHGVVALRAPISPVRLGRELRRYPDITAAEMMKETLAREMGATTARTNLTHVEVADVAFGAETRLVEKSKLEIVLPRKNGQVVRDVSSRRHVLIAMLCLRLGDRRNRTARVSDPPQEVQSSCFNDCGVEVWVSGHWAASRLGKSCGFMVLV